MTKIIPPSIDTDHALCGASNSARWLNCPGSVAMELKAPKKPSSVYAEEGTRAHELAEIYLQLLVNHYHKTGKDLRKETDIRNFATKEDYPIEMRDHCWAYACLIMDEVFKRKPKKVLIEKKVVLHQNYGMFGTADCFFGYRNKKGEIILCVYDLKYGKGYVVEANSPQLVYYGLAVAETFKLTPDKYILNVFQPRADHVDGPHRVRNLSAKDSINIKDQFIQGAYKALKMSQNEESDLELHAGDHCGFCAAQAVCGKYTQHLNENAAMDFTEDPALLVPEVINQRDEISTTLSDEQISKILTHSKEIEKFLSNVKEYAINRYEQGDAIPGWKVVETRPRRRWEGSNTEIATALNKLGVKDPWERKLRGLGSIEGEIREVQSVTAKKAKSLIQPLCGMTTPNKTLAPEDDERPGIDGNEDAKRDFQDIEVETVE